MLRNLRVWQKLCLFAVVMGILIFAVGSYGYYINVTSQQLITGMYESALKPVEWLDDSRAHARANEANLLYVILYSGKQAKQEPYLTDIANRVKKIDQNLANFRALNLTPFEIGKLESLEKYQTAFRKIRAKVIELAKEGKPQEALAHLVKNHASLDQYQNDLVQLAQYNVQEAENTSSQSRNSAADAGRLLLTLLIIAIGIAIVLTVVITRQIVRPLSTLVTAMAQFAQGDLQHSLDFNTKDEIGILGQAAEKMRRSLVGLIQSVMLTSEQVSASSEELASAAHETGQGAQQVATTVEQLASGTQEQAQAVIEIQESLNRVSTLTTTAANRIQNQVLPTTQQTVASAKDGMKVAEDAVTQIGAITVAAQDVGKSIHQLSSMAHEIGGIVGMISDISSQTNLLALNAAIEAARAGEAGRGFAVVAGEVRSLAEQSNEATRRISTLVHQVQNSAEDARVKMDQAVEAVDSGTKIIKHSHEAFSDISTAVEDVSSQVQSVVDDTGRIASENERVLQALNDVAAVVEENAAGAEEASAATEQQTAMMQEVARATNELASMAQNLQSVVAQFQM